MKPPSDFGHAVLQFICVDGLWMVSKAIEIAGGGSKVIDFDIRREGRTFIARVAPYRIWEVERPIFIVEFELAGRRCAEGPSHRVSATALSSSVGLLARVTVQRMWWDAAQRWPKP